MNLRLSSNSLGAICLCPCCWQALFIDLTYIYYGIHSVLLDCSQIGQEDCTEIRTPASLSRTQGRYRDQWGTRENSWLGLFCGRINCRALPLWYRRLSNYLPHWHPTWVTESWTPSFRFSNPSTCLDKQQDGPSLHSDLLTMPAGVDVKRKVPYSTAGKSIG